MAAPAQAVGSTHQHGRRRFWVHGATLGSPVRRYMVRGAYGGGGGRAVLLGAGWRHRAVVLGRRRRMGSRVVVPGGQRGVVVGGGAVVAGGVGMGLEAASFGGFGIDRRRHPLVVAGDGCRLPARHSCPRVLAVGMPASLQLLVNVDEKSLGAMARPEPRASSPGRAEWRRASPEPDPEPRASSPGRAEPCCAS